MFTTCLKFTKKLIYRLTLLSLTTNLLSSCSPSHQLGVADNPQALLDRKLNDPHAVLTPAQSISLVNHCTELGERNAAVGQNKEACLVLGNTGAGKSTFLNYMMGCKLKAVRPGELGLPGAKKVIIVDPDSAIPAVMPVGHGRASATFLPQIELDSQNQYNAYCDCPGFEDTRGAEINIANSINIKKVLRQTSRVKAILLASYADISEDRGCSIKAMEAICRQMFGGVANLRRHQNTILLGITKAPVCDEYGDPITRSMIRSSLEASGTDIALILAKRVFLCDPLDRGTNNPDFWSLERCRNEIVLLDTIPQYEAAMLFQTALTARDQKHLFKIVRQIRPQITRAIEQNDVATMRRHWQLLQRLQVIQHNEVKQLIREVLPAIYSATHKLSMALMADIAVRNFDDTQQKLNRITAIVNNLPGATLAVDIARLHSHLKLCRKNSRNEKAVQQELVGLRNKLARTRRQADRRGEVFQLVGTIAGAILGGPGGAFVGHILGKAVEDGTR